MVVGWFLYIKGVVITKQWGDQRPEFKISAIQLLSEIREKLSKSIQVDIRPKSVNEKLISQIEGLIVDNPGKCSFKVNIVDEQENIAVDLLSRKFMVNPNDELLNSLNDIPEVQFKVST
jgi:DNA polymerase-3 subunit alpha